MHVNYPELYLAKSRVTLDVMDEKEVNDELEELKRKLKAALKATVAKTREELNKSQGDLLAELKKYGMSRSQGSVSQIETGVRLPSLEALYVISKFLDTSTDYLLGLTTNQLSSADIEEELATSKGAGKIDKLINKLSRAKKKQVLDYAEYLLSRESNIEKKPLRLSPLPLTERQRNLAMIRARLDSVEKDYGIIARRDMEESIREELSGDDSAE